MKISVFGSSGFIGKNLINSLLQNNKVHEISLRNLSWKNDIDVRTQIFINLVGKAPDQSGVAVDEDYVYANVFLTQEIFKVFLNSNATIMIHVSSIAASEEFSALRPLKENDKCNPISIYGKTKKQAEEWLANQYIPDNKKLVIIRPPMIHGPGDIGNLNLLYHLISKGVPYPLASFHNERSFLSIDNFIFYIEQIIKKSTILENGIYHIADNETVSTGKIIKIMKIVLQKNTPDILVPKFIIRQLARMGDFIPLPLNTNKLKKMTCNLIVSNQKINTALNITELPFTADQGLLKTINSF